MTAKLAGSHADLEILIDGQPAPLYPHGGHHWLESVSGTRFEISATNRHGGRILVLCAVDGRDVLDDRPADVHTSRGMILRPGEAYTFRGWRTSDAETRGFVFTTVEQGVAAQVGGDLTQVGQIGIGVWTEAPPPTPPVSYGAGYRGSVTRSAGPVLSANPPPASHSVGIGATQADAVGSARFERGELVQVTGVFYRDAAILAAMGVTSGSEPAPPALVRGYARLTSPESTS